MTLEHYKKVARGAGLAIGGALIAYVGQWAISGDFGQYGPVLAAACSVALNFLRVFSNTVDAPEEPEHE